MSTPAGLEQRQQVVEERAWAASILRAAAAEIRRNAVFRALVAELVGKLVTRSDTDAALVVVCPGAHRAVERYYSGEGLELRRLLADAELRVLDRWLANEVKRWAARWRTLDPVRRGSASSTREALDQVKREIAAHAVPNAVASITAKLRSGGSRRE